MSYFDFMLELECIAAEKDLRVFIERASVGSSFLFYFQSESNGMRSPHILWLNGREDPEELFARLRKLADNFNITIGCMETLESEGTDE